MKFFARTRNYLLLLIGICVGWMFSGLVSSVAPVWISIVLFVVFGALFIAGSRASAE